HRSASNLRNACTVSPFHPTHQGSPHVFSLRYGRLNRRERRKQSWEARGGPTQGRNSGVPQETERTRSLFPLFAPVPRVRPIFRGPKFCNSQRTSNDFAPTDQQIVRSKARPVSAPSAFPCSFHRSARRLRLRDDMTP